MTSGKALSLCSLEFLSKIAYSLSTQTKLNTSQLKTSIYLLETSHPRTTKQLTWTYNTAYITNIPHSVFTGYVHAHSTLWHWYINDHRGQLIADVISNSDHITLNTNTPTRMPNTTIQTSSPDITSVSNTHYALGHRGQFNANYHQTTYPSSPQSTYDMTTYYNKTDELLQTTRKPTGHNLPKTQESTFAQTTIPTNIHTANINCFTKQFTNTVKDATHKTNMSINRETHEIQGYQITLTTTQVQEAIKQSKPNNSQGHDKLNIRHLKHIGPLGLAFLLKTALNTNTIPHIGKLANIVPIPKLNKEIDKAHIPPLSNCKDTGEESSSLHNSKHTKHNYVTRIQNTTLYSDGSTRSKQHRSEGV